MFYHNNECLVPRYVGPSKSDQKHVVDAAREIGADITENGRGGLDTFSCPRNGECGNCPLAELRVLKSKH